MANYPIPYQPTWNYSGIRQQVYPNYTSQTMQPAQQTSQTQQTMSMIWTDGEVGAKAFQRPDWLPANQPIALWDTNDTIIYLKSWNPMGMPNPLQRAHYKLENVNSGEKTQGYSGDMAPDMSQYVKKEDLERLKVDLMDAIGSMGSTTGRHTAKGE